MSGRTLTAATAGGSLADGALQAATANAPTIAIRIVIMPSSLQPALTIAVVVAAAFGVIPDVAEV